MMNATQGSDGSSEGPQLCEIRVQGQLEARWAGMLEGMTLTPGSGGVTTLTGPLVDQAALHGLLARIRDLGLPILSFRHLLAGDEPGEDHTTKHRSNTP